MAQYDLEIFQRDLEAFGIALSGEQTGQFLRYYELLLDWNGRMNLTAITGYQEVLKKHFVDSLSLVKVCRPGRGDALIDVGTGAGFPGLALKIAFPGLKVTLLDSLNKRIQFLNAAIEELRLDDVEAVYGRAEDYAAPGRGREGFDFCVSRAVANLSTLSEYCLPFVKKGGLFIAYKSEKGAGEVADAQRAMAVLGGRLRESVEFTLPDSDIRRNLVVVEKVQKTPAKYPRKAGLPSKEPIRGTEGKQERRGTS